MLITSALTNVTALVALVYLKPGGMFWVHPAMVFNYALLGTRAAVWANKSFLCRLRDECRRRFHFAVAVEAQKSIWATARFFFNFLPTWFFLGPVKFRKTVVS